MLRRYKVLILIAAAVLGTVYYQRYLAVRNIAGGSLSFYSDTRSPIGAVGGVGPVGNPKR